MKHYHLSLLAAGVSTVGAVSPSISLMSGICAGMAVINFGFYLESILKEGIDYGITKKG